ncbi:MAG TPA: TonB-dependent receptor [Paucimonas sp.]|nr:TonB-dependent receptor [Paucimonas sp.]
MRLRFDTSLTCLSVLLLCALPVAAQEMPPQPQVVTVLGQGQTRQVQNITRDDLAKALPGTSPLKLLDKLPGVQFQSADAFGAYEWSISFSIRGFSQSQLGYTLDGVPLGDMSYTNNNGLHISRAIAAENIRQVTVSQGAGAVGTASTSNLGGTVQFLSADPTDEPELFGEQTAGSGGSHRSFVRWNSGRLASGTKAYVSAAHLYADKWKGDGGQHQDQFDAKLVHPFGPHRLTAFYHYSDRKETDYQDMSLDMKARLGWDWDNYAPNFQAALDKARSPECTTDYRYTCDDAYYLGHGLRRDDLSGVALDLHPAPGRSLTMTAYHHSNQGQGHWYTPYTPTSPAMPLSIRATEYRISRNGVVATAKWEAGNHALEAGYWGEANNHDLFRNFYPVTGPEDTLRFLSDPFATAYYQVFHTRTAQFHLQDTMSFLDDALTVNLGFKSPRVRIDAASPVGGRAAGTIEARRSFLPQAGVRYEFARNHEVFTSATKNMRAFQTGYSGPFQQTQPAFDRGAGTLKPETAATFDLGYRYTGRTLTGSLALYRADFSDRLTTVALCAGIIGCPNSVVNVGKVRSAGMEAALVWSFRPRWTWFGSLTRNDSKYRSDYVDGTTTVRTNGKRVVDTPRTMFTTELGYDNGAWFGRAHAKHVGKRYYTYLNDAEVPAYRVVSLAGGYRIKALGALRDVALEARIENALDRRYFSTVGTNGFVASDPGGTYATLQTGVPRQFFLTFSAKL